MPEPLIPYRTQLFDKQIKSIPPSDLKRINLVISRLVNNPDNHDGTLGYDRAGKFKKYVGKSGYRIVYYYCEKCIKLQHEEMMGCENCKDVPENSLILFEIFRRSQGY